MKLESFALEPGLVDEVDRFMAGHPVAELPVDLEARFAALVAFERDLHEAGLAVVAWPERLGGRGLSAADAALVGVRAGCPFGAGARQLRGHRGGGSGTARSCITRAARAVAATDGAGRRRVVPALQRT